MASKSFDVTLGDTVADATGFNGTNGFVAVHIGKSETGRACIIITDLNEARALAEAIMSAANFAQPVEAGAADFTVAA